MMRCNFSFFCMRLSYFILPFLLILALPALGVESLNRLQSVYEQQKSRIDDSFRQSRLALPPAHLSQLKRLELFFLQQNQEEAYQVVRSARLDFIDALSVETDGELPAELVTLNRQYDRRLRQTDFERLQQLDELNRQFRSALAKLGRSLQQAGNPEGVAAVREAIAGMGDVSDALARYVPQRSAASNTLRQRRSGGTAASTRRPRIQSHARSPMVIAEGESGFDILVEEWFK